MTYTFTGTIDHDEEEGLGQRFVKSAAIDALVDELQPKPEFKVGDWVWARDANRVYRFMGRDRKWCQLYRLDGTQRQCLDNELEPLGCDLLNLARQYHDGKLISTDGLPELASGERYVIVGGSEYVEQGVREARTRQGESAYLAIRKKEAPDG